MSNNDKDKYVTLLEGVVDQLKQEASATPQENQEQLIYKDSIPPEDRYLKEDIDEQKATEEIADLKDNRILRNRLSYGTFFFMVAINISCFFTVYLTLSSSVEISATALSILNSSSPASMVLFGWILKGLFQSK